MTSAENSRCSAGHDAGDNGVSAAAPHPESHSGLRPKENDEWLALRQFDWRAKVRQHPYGTLAAAAGIGYLLGGGLFSRPTARFLGFALRLGARLVAIPVLGNELLGLATRSTAQMPENDSPKDDSPEKPKP